MAEKDTGAGFAIGFIAGAAIGLVIGFLYAPQSGKETRERLKGKAEEVKEKATEVTEKVKKAATEAKQKAQAKMSKLLRRRWGRWTLTALSMS